VRLQQPNAMEKKIMKNNEQYHERNLFANYDD
jgi:hypothetical protein